MQKRRVATAITVFSLACSVKMNVLLFGPGAVLVAMRAAPLSATLRGVAAGIALQVALGWPFLRCAPWAYVANAFNFSRQFVYYWSVNFKFMPEEVFLSSSFSRTLLVTHILLLLTFAHCRWCRSMGGLRGLTRISISWFGRRADMQPLASDQLAEVAAILLFEGNFLGIVCARTLHYQFYSWYFHTLPMLLWSAHLPTAGRLVLFAVVELSFNVFPSTFASSLALLVAHAVLILALLRPWCDVSGKSRTA